MFSFLSSRPARGEEKALSTLGGRNGTWHSVLESFTGAWQKNVEVKTDTVLSYFAVYSCMTLIASDIAKLRVKLIQKDANNVWTETENPAYSPVLRKPNRQQTRIQFWEHYFLSKLSTGNVYVLKRKDQRGVVVSLHILDPRRVMPMVSDDGSVFYQLSADNLSGLSTDVVVPADEIIHDRMNCIFHPMIGTSPVMAAGIAAMQGTKIQEGSAKFFDNASQPGGILTAPGSIPAETAERLKAVWQENYSGNNAGKVAVLGDGLKFEPMAATAQESQLIEQLRWTADVICSVFHVPRYKIGVGEVPAYNNVQSLNVEYYTQALQSQIEHAESCLSEGLGLGARMDIQFDVDGLLRMDSISLIESLKIGVGSGITAPNEARQKVNLPPVEGGEAPYLQEQNWSLADLSKRSQIGIAPTQAEPTQAEPTPEETQRAYNVAVAASMIKGFAA